MVLMKTANICYWLFISAGIFVSIDEGKMLVIAVFPPTTNFKYSTKMRKTATTITVIIVNNNYNNYYSL